MRRVFHLFLFGAIIQIWVVTNSFSAPNGKSFSNQKNSFETSPYEGRIIDSIVINNRNIYDTKKRAYSSFIFKLANKFHYKTRKNIIKQELLLKKGDHFSKKLADESTRNLRSRLVVYDAWITIDTLSNGHIIVTVTTIDQWSLTGSVDINREGNETTYDMGVDEKNFMGNNLFLSYHYFVQSEDDNYFYMTIFDQRFLEQPYEIELQYNNDPKNKVEGLWVTHPYYNLSQKFAYGFDLKNLGGRRDIYSDSVKIAYSNKNGDRFHTNLSYRWGSYNRKVNFNFSYLYNYEESSNKTIISPHTSDSSFAMLSFPQDSLYHQLGIGIGFSDFSFIKLHRIDGFGYTEDFMLGSFIKTGYARAFKEDFRGNVFDIANFSLSRYFAYKANLFFFDYAHLFWLQGNRKIRHITNIMIKYYNHSLDYATLAFRLAYWSDWDINGSNNILLGGTTGIRGYNKYFRTGNKKIILNVEDRFFTNMKFLSVMMGGAIFMDMGNVWNNNESFRLKDFNISVGGGFRFAFEESSKKIVRIDLAYSKQNQWEFSIGANQYFSAQNSY